MILSVGPVPPVAPVLRFKGVALWVASELVQLAGPTGRTSASSGGDCENVSPWPRCADRRAEPTSSLGQREAESKVASEAIPPEHDIVHEWGIQSFPASDPPANW
jgi:hypothetical protein